MNSSDVSFDGPKPPAGAAIPEFSVVSTVDAVARVLRDLIVDGSIPPGERIREVEYAQGFGCARHTLRAAVQVLEHEGLLVRTRNRGVHVPVLGEADFVDIYRLRSAIELEAVRTVIVEGRSLTGGQAALKAFRDMPSDSAPWRELVNLDLRFHRAVVEAAQSPRLIRAYRTVEPEITLSLVRLRAHYDEPVGQITAEHAELLEPVADGDWPEAERRFRAHLNVAVANLTKFLDQDGAR